MNDFIIIFILTIFFSGVVSWRTLFRGKEEYDNIMPPYRSDAPKEFWFNQTLDHFDPTNKQHWKQRYYMNDSFFDSANGPVFLMIGGEAPINAYMTVDGTWVKYAEKNKALCLVLEHRYYGESHPVGDLSVKNLIYLSSVQALADTASFITYINQKLKRKAKWIVFGGSYAGSLAAWMRLKYPHLVLGAVSSSGPLLAVLDFKEYFEVVERVLHSYNPECVDAIIKGTEQITKFMADSAGQQKLHKLFELCEIIDPHNKNDIYSLYNNLADNFATIVQYNNDNRQGGYSTKLNVSSLCNIMTDKSAGGEIDRLAIINSIILRGSKRDCFEYKYGSFIETMRSTDWSSIAGNGMRQWTYQTCTEFGFFQTSTSNDTRKMFGLFPVDFYELQCKDIYGKKFDQDLLELGIKQTNMFYGALKIEVDNVVFVHGSDDPWHALGIIKTLNKKSPAIFINGTAHCANMYPSSPQDLPQLVDARRKIGRLIEMWLN